MAGGTPSPASAHSPGRAIRELYGALWQHAQGMRGTLVAALSLLGASQLVRLSMPWLAGQAINALQRGDIGGSGRWIGALMGIYLVSWLLHGPGRVLERNVGVHVRERLGELLYARIAAAPLAWHGAHHSGELQHRVHQSSRALSDFAQNQFVYVQSTLSFVGPLAALALLSWHSGALALVGYVLIAFIILRFDQALMRLARQENDADRRYVAALLDFVGNASTVIGLRLQAASRRLLGLRMQAISAPLKRAVVVNEGKWFAVDLLGLGLSWALVVLYVWQQLRASGGDAQAVLLGTVFMIYQYAQQAASVAGSMAANFQSFARMHTDYGSAAPLWETPGNPAGPVPAIDPAAPWHTLALHDMHCGYGDGSRGGLHALGIVLQRGARVALIGPSGGGKSTLLRVLAGLYTPQQGTLQLDGQVQDWPALRRLATLIPQEAEVFEASVRENLGFGEAHEDSALEATARISAFDEVLARMPDGLDSALTERGLNLSGGQRQRLALARGALAATGSSLLLLDEPTSALDAATEARVLERMSAAFPQACIVASIHRLSLLSRFDTVVVLEAGRIVDAGPRDEVMARQPARTGAGEAPPPP